MGETGEDEGVSCIWYLVVSEGFFNEIGMYTEFVLFMSGFVIGAYPRLAIGTRVKLWWR